MRRQGCFSVIPGIKTSVSPPFYHRIREASLEILRAVFYCFILIRGEIFIRSAQGIENPQIFQGSCPEADPAAAGLNNPGVFHSLLKASVRDFTEWIPASVGIAVKRHDSLRTKVQRNGIL